MKQLNLLLVAIFLCCNFFAHAQCAKPDGVTPSVTANNLPGTASVSWGITSYAVGTTFVVEYKTPTATVWNVIPALTSPSQLTGLATCTSYIVRVKAICTPGTTTGMSEYSLEKTFITNGCPSTSCAAPVITATPVVGTAIPPVYAATVTWATTGYAIGTTYTIEYKKSAATVWTVSPIPSTTSPANIYNLDACTEYQIRVKANCSSTLSSAYSNIVTVTTAGCIPTCAAPTAYTSAATPTLGATTYQANVAWNTSAYATGTTYIVEYKKNTATTWTTAAATASPYIVSGLATCSEYQFRVKANCSTTLSSAYSNQTATQTGGCPPPCLPAVVQAAADTSATAGNVTWATAAYAAGTTFMVEYKLPSAATWTVATTSATASPYKITGLTACTEYLVRVTANCGNIASNTAAFKTVGCAPPCPTPGIQASADTSATKGKVYWSVTPYAAGTTFTVEYKLSAATTWIVATTTAATAPYIITGLTACTEYSVRVKANCGTAYSNNSSFKTVGCVLPTPCIPPVVTGTATQTAGATTYQVALTWATTAYAAGTTYTVEYRKNTATTWTTATATSSPYTVTVLDACSEYLFRIKANCSTTSSSAYSNTFGVLTGGCTPACPTPSAQASADTSATKGKVYWSVTPYAAGTTFTVEYKLPSAATWTIATTTAATVPYIITGLTACTEYQVRIKASCGTAYSNTTAFKTVGCVVPTPCLAPIVSATPDTANTKGKVTFVTANYPTGTTFTVEYKLPSTTTWIAATATTSPYILTGLTACTEYQVRVKANCSTTSSSNYTQASFKTSGCPAPSTCAKPSAQAYVNPALSAITGSVYFGGAGYSSTTTFTIEYKLPSATTWTVATSTATTNPYTITSGLTACTEYQVRVKANCSTTLSSAYSNTTAFTTVGCVPCPLPTNLNVSAVTTTSANVAWAGTAASYTLQYKMALSTTAAWTTVNVTTNSYAITGLSTCKYYIVRVAANCPPNSALVFTNTRTFKTTGCILATANTPEESLVVAPNPGSNVLNVSYIVENEGVVKIDIINVQGQTVRNLMNENLTSGYYQNAFNEVEALTPGVYFINLQSADGEKRVQRWIKN